MSASHPEIQKHVKTYWIIFGALIVGTIVTVGASNIHFGIMLGIAVAILIAAVKGSLVAGFFMHLLHEAKMLYWLLALTAVFFVVLIGLILASAGDQQGAHHGIFQVPVHHATPHVPGAAGEHKE